MGGAFPPRSTWNHSDFTGTQLGIGSGLPSWSQGSSLMSPDVTRTLLGWQLPLGAPQDRRTPSLGTVPIHTSWEGSASPPHGNPELAKPPGVPQWSRSHPVPTGAPRWPPPARGLGYGGGHARLRRKGDKREVPDPGRRGWHAATGTGTRCGRGELLLGLSQGTRRGPPAHGDMEGIPCSWGHRGDPQK